MAERSKRKGTTRPKSSKTLEAQSVNRLLFSLADAVNSTFNLEDLYQRIHVLLGEVIDVTNIFIAIVDLNRKTIRFPYFVDTTEDDYFEISDFDTSKSLTGMVALAKRPMLLKREQLLDREGARGILGTTPLIWMGVPLIVRDEVIGVVAVQSYTDPEAYDEDDLNLMAAVSHQIALAIDRKQSLDGLVSSEQRYRILFDHLFDALFLVDRKHLIIDCNSKAVEMTGYANDHLQQVPFTDLIAPADRHIVKATLESVKKDGDHLFQAVLITAAGLQLDIEISIRLVAIAESQVFQVLVRDVTEKKLVQKEREQLEERLNRSRRMEAIGLLAGGVAHDLNNILSGIVSYPELILMDLEADSQLAKHVRAIHEAGRRAADVVDDLLTIAKSAATIKRPGDLHKLVREYLTSPECLILKERYPDARIIHSLKAKRTVIDCSPVHIKKCLMNLVNNAVEAINGEGTVSISTAETAGEGCEGESSARNRTDIITLRITDDGSGIASEDLNRIFEPFYTKKTMGRTGTGLGLAVVWNTMQDHNGEVLVQSCASGTEFTLKFPVSETQVEIGESSTEVHLHRGRGQSVLVVDDEPQNREIALNILRALGYQSTAVESGEAAVEFVRQQSVDIVLLDMILGGINGRETYEQILKVRPGQRAVIASGFSQSDEVKLAMQLGVSSFIKKPYTMDELAAAMFTALYIGSA